MKTVILIAAFIISSASSAQSLLERIYDTPFDTNQVLKEMTYSLINYVLEDSIYINCGKLSSRYGGCVTYTEGVRIPEKKHKRKRNHTDSVNIKTLGQKVDYFYLRQKSDTTTTVDRNLILKKAVVDYANWRDDCCIFVEKIIFSDGFNEACIRTSIGYFLDCEGYESRYKREKGKWKKIECRITSRS